MTYLLLDILSFFNMAGSTMILHIDQPYSHRTGRLKYRLKRTPVPVICPSPLHLITDL